MASSRQMRRTGAPSFRPPTTESDPPSHNANMRSYSNSADYDDWLEPALRPPVPSFEDYKGLERQGVLEHMAPLGTLPSSKVKARIRQSEAPWRAFHLKNGEPRIMREDVVPPETAPSPATAMSTIPRHDGPLPEYASPQTYIDGQNHDARLYNAEIPVHPSPASQIATPTAAPTPFMRPPTTKAADANQKKVVDTAIKRANDMHKFSLGIAIQNLYDQALYDRRYLDLLNAVLYQKTTVDQNAEFGTFIKSARKQAKRSGRGTKQSTPSLSASHGDHSTHSATRQADRSEERGDKVMFDRTSPTSTGATPLKAPTSKMVVNGSPTITGQPEKKVKRSRSTSTESSLSSVNSDIEEFSPRKIDSAMSKAKCTHVSLQPPKARPGAGPRMGSFSTSTLPHDEDSPEARVAARRQRECGWENYHTNHESAVRSPISPPRKLTPPPTALQQRARLPRRNGTGLRSQVDVNDSSDSPLSSQDDLSPPPAGVVTGSTSQRGITPQLGRPPKAAKKAARIKQSPLKKRNGVTAGLAPPTEPETHQVNGGRSEDVTVDSDVCWSCSGNGSLILCDECSRGFHFTCCDPPLHPETRHEELPEQWFCPRCASKRTNTNPSSKPRGLFTELNKAMRSYNPVAFHLPRQLRDHFEGVATGEEGEYEEVHNVKISKARSGFEETPDNFRLKDRKDNTILCFRCGGTTNGKREIVPCDYCNLCWHLDCLDPPLATAPHKKTANGKPRQAWMCPNHVDHELVNLKASTTAGGKHAIRKPSNAQPEELQRVFRTRRPKHPTIVDVGLRRGFRNNGVIEIEEDPSEDESDIERELSGVIYRIPERGIKLDFIDRIKQQVNPISHSQISNLCYSRSNLETQSYQACFAPRSHRRRKAQHIQTTKPSVPTLSLKQRDGFDKRPFRERKAALNLMQLARDGAEFDPDQVANLIQTLTAEAPSEVEQLLAPTEADEEQTPRNGAALPPVSEREKKDLEALIRLAQERLQSSSS